MFRPLLAAALAACAVAPSALADTVYAVTQNQTLITFNSATPGAILSGVPIMGLQPNETVHGIDFRPATGELFALGSFSRLYTINPATGVATQIGVPFSPALNGSSFGFDFNPTVDRIRIVSDADQNLRVNPVTGAVAAVDGTLAYAAGDSGFGMNPDVVHAAYTNSFAGATTTTLYVIDSDRDVLCIQNANLGTLTTVGPLGTNVTDFGGFDISPLNNTAFAAVRDATMARSTFWTINLATGQAAMIGEIGGGALVTAIAVVPSPGAAALAAAGALFAARRRR